MENTNTRRGFTQSCFPKGFTLIELLVVVLIIGILAAVAVPQYRKAVEKSRFVQAITTTRAIYNAALRYRLANGQYPTQAEELDISVGAPTSNSSIINTKGHQCYLDTTRVYCMSTSQPFYTFHLFYDGKEQCCSYPNDSFAADALCAAQIGKKLDQWGGGKSYHCFLKSY